MNFNVPLALVYGQETISNTALSLADMASFTAAQVDASSRVVVSVRSGSVNILWTGDDPTISTGHNLLTSDIFQVLGNQNIVLFRIIRNGASNATVDITLES